MKKNYTYIFLLTILSSCELINNKEEKIPSYLHIDKINLNTDYSLQGSNASEITDAWVYVDDQTIGVFELPVTFPILAEGTHEIKIKAGIKNDDINTIRVPYTFYDYYTATINLLKDSVIKINPSVNYTPYSTFDWREDFEGAAFSIVDTSGTDTVMKFNTVSQFEGNKCGEVNLDAAKTYYLGKSASTFTLPQGGSSVWLELNYTSNNQFGVGIYSSNISSPQLLLVVNPSDVWNKIYIELTPATSNAGNINPFCVFINMTKSYNVSAPRLLIDNIKLLH